MTKDEGQYHALRIQDSDSDEYGDSETALPHVVHKKSNWLKFHYGFITIAYVILIVLYLLKIRSDNQPSSNKTHHVFPSLREGDALQYESRKLPILIAGNPFAGKPRPELDQAWHELFEKNNIRVTKADLEFYNITSLPIISGSLPSQDIDSQNHDEWVGQLGVFHELHCLKRIRHWVYRDYYLENASQRVLIEESAHVDHCIELLREAIMCHADPTLSGFRWIQTDGTPHLTVEAPGYHECVNWDSLRAWNDDRAVDAFEPGVVAGPDAK
ncbi:hypothetical protein PISL3812_06219 [Talaromyces islandicus]|uniref:Cyclochlorotine biosynthesis protein O n=1 Tax=Talaromyces islandicus TaxID=28573 RepID=A0A0U1M0X4_TALIS|nr:hypothetical protein PISL3812_06219 [Talaromyces islandicus]